MRFEFENFVPESVEQRAIITQAAAYQKFLLEENLYKEALSYLEARIKESGANDIAPRSFGQTVPGGTGRPRKTLSSELASKEVEFGGFNKGVPIYFKVLSDKAFTELSEKIRHFKDVGAGFVHGEYTHRIQWYVCMYHQTDGFTTRESNGFSLTPAEMFRAVSTFGNISIQFWPRRKVSGGGGLWDALFDRNSSDISLKTDGITGPELFNQALFDMTRVPELGLRSDALGLLAKDYPCLSNIITNRYIKRKEGITPEDNDQLDRYAEHKATSGKYTLFGGDLTGGALEPHT